MGSQVLAGAPGARAAGEAPHGAPSEVSNGAPNDAPGGARGVVRRLVGPEAFAEARAVYKLATPAERRAPLPASFKLWAWRRGFKARHAAIYDRAGVERGEYLSDYAQLYRCDRLNPIPALFDHKLVLRQILADRGLAQPETLALVTEQGVVADPLGSARQTDARALEAELAADGGRFIVKPQDGRFGARIALVEARGGALVTRRGRDARPFVMGRDARPVSLVERAVEQHAFWQALSPFSVNTMRVLTLWTPGDAEPFIARAVQRIGTEETLPTDNWSGGSVCARVDLETGALGPGRISPDDKGAREDRPYTHHPDTGAPITGLVLPHWDRIREAVLHAARSVPYARYIGWDVAVDAAGTPVFIEGNHNTQVRMLQAHSGLLADPATRRFYEVCGVLGA